MLKESRHLHSLHSLSPALCLPIHCAFTFTAPTLCIHCIFAFTAHSLLLHRTFTFICTGPSPFMAPRCTFTFAVPSVHPHCTIPVRSLHFHCIFLLALRLSGCPDAMRAEPVHSAFTQSQRLAACLSVLLTVLSYCLSYCLAGRLAGRPADCQTLSLTATLQPRYFPYQIFWR